MDHDERLQDLQPGCHGVALCFFSKRVLFGCREYNTQGREATCKILSASKTWSDYSPATVWLSRRFHGSRELQKKNKNRGEWVLSLQLQPRPVEDRFGFSNWLLFHGCWNAARLVLLRWIPALAVVSVMWRPLDDCLEGPDKQCYRPCHYHPNNLSRLSVHFFLIRPRRSMWKPQRKLFQEVFILVGTRCYVIFVVSSNQRENLYSSMCFVTFSIISNTSQGFSSRWYFPVFLTPYFSSDTQTWILVHVFDNLIMYLCFGWHNDLNWLDHLISCPVDLYLEWL